MRQLTSEISVIYEHGYSTPMVFVRIVRDYEVFLVDEFRITETRLWSPSQFEEFVAEYGLKSEKFFEAINDAIDTNLKITYLRDDEREIIKQEVILLIMVNVQ